MFLFWFKMNVFADCLTDWVGIPDNEVNLVLTSVQQKRVSIKAFGVHPTTVSTLINVYLNQICWWEFRWDYPASVICLFLASGCHCYILYNLSHRLEHAESWWRHGVSNLELIYQKRLIKPIKPIYLTPNWSEDQLERKNFLFITSKLIMNMISWNVRLKITLDN